MMPSPKKQILSNGLYILNIKKKTNQLVLLSLTDFNNTERFIFDVSEKKIKSDKDLKLKPSDIDLIDFYVKNSELKDKSTEKSNVEV